MAAKSISHHEVIPWLKLLLVGIYRGIILFRWVSEWCESPRKTTILGGGAGGGEGIKKDTPTDGPFF